MHVTQVLGHGLIYLLDGHRRGMRRLEQALDSPTVGLDLPGGDRVVCLNLEVEDRSSIWVQTVANFLGQGELCLAGECGEREDVPSE